MKAATANGCQRRSRFASRDTVASSDALSMGFEICKFPEMARLMSNRSVRSRAWRRALRSMTSTAVAIRSGPGTVFLSICVQPRTALSGLRSSCYSVARNSSRIRAARCASARASRSRCTNRSAEVALPNCAATSSIPGVRSGCGGGKSTRRQAHVEKPAVVDEDQPWRYRDRRGNRWP